MRPQARLAVGKLGERIIVGALIDGDNSADEFREHAMAAAGKP